MATYGGGGTSGTGNPDDVTQRLGSDAATEAMNANAQTEVAPDDATVAIGDPTLPPTQAHPAPSTPHSTPLPRRVPPRFDAPPAARPPSGSSSSPGKSIPGKSIPGTSIRIGKGVTAATARNRLRAGRPASRRWLGRATRILSGLATIAIVIVAAWTAWQWWHRVHNRVSVDTVAVAPARSLTGSCDVQYDLVGTITTNGQAGTISYEWVRSDGQRTGTLSQRVAAGQTSTTVHLYWKFTGQGSMNATATLRVLAPTKMDGVAKFQYLCP